MVEAKGEVGEEDEAEEAEEVLFIVVSTRLSLGENFVNIFTCCGLQLFEDNFLFKYL